MRSKILPALKAMIFVVGAISLQACFYEGHPYYGGPEPYAYGPAPAYAYGPPPSYIYAPPARMGDYDDHHEWHDRDWWVKNDHPWVQQHHPDWVGSRDHDRDGDHDRH